MSQYSSEVISEELQQELLNAVKRVQDKLDVKFMVVNMELNIYGAGSKVAFSIVPDHVSKPVS